MNILKFSNDVTYLTPDMNVINVSLDAMLAQSASAQLAFEATGYLPTVYEKASPLRTSIVTVHLKVDEQLYTLGTLTDTALRKLNECRAEITEDMVEEERSLNLYAREQTIITFKKGFSTAAKALQDQYKTISGVTFDPALTTTYKEKLLDELPSLNAQITAIDKNLRTLDDSRTIINDAMALLEKKNVADVARDTLLTVESLSALGLAAPEVELIKLAMEHMRKTLEHISEAINYQTMYDERAKLIDTIQREKSKKEARVAEVNTVTHKTILLTSIHELFASFFCARAEYAKIDQSVNAFVNYLALSDEADFEDQFVGAAPSFIAYVNSAH
jgi:hypothetical protein